MTAQLIVQETDGMVQVSHHREGGYGENPAGAVRLFVQPFTVQDLEDLRWYLEDYLMEPYAVYEERGERIAAGLDGMGEKLFGAVFGDDPAALMAFGAARKEPAGCELVIQSESPAFLGLPWELLKAPDQTEPMVLALEGIVRTTAAEQMASVEMPGEALRILMIIARPMGERDVRYRLIARELMKCVEAVSGKVELEVLRPPTTDELKKRLIAAKEEGRPFQMLHFDGHGNFEEGGGPQGGLLSPLKFSGRAPGGYLFFEKADGTDDPVAIGTVVDLLKTARAEIPLFVLNACRSGTVKEVGEVGPEAGTATALLRHGAAAVVAMSYSVYAAAAAEHMTAFYEALFRGEPVTRAMQSGLEQMRRRPFRPSNKGPLPLQDWMVPVHYAQKKVAFPHLAATRTKKPFDLDEALDRVRRQSKAPPSPEGAHEEGALDPVGVFFGRDAEFLKLERTLRKTHVALLHAVGGMGKTELAKAFAKWLWETGGLDAPPFFFSFEPGIASFGLSGVVTSAGLRLFGQEFARLDPKDRIAVMQDALSKHRLLLVLDNFESVCSMPAEHQQTLVLNDEQKEEMRAFLTHISANASVGAIITSRSKETWLGGDDVIRRIALEGLAPEDATDYAETLVPEEARPKQSQKYYAELIEHLEGHPLTMRLILPLLETESPAAMVKGLKGQGELPPGFDKGEGRLESLGASVYYSFRHLGEEDQQRLPALALFEGVVDEEVLGILSKMKAAPARLKGIPKESWQATLARCADAGLVSSLGPNLYRIHPALSGFLTAYWNAEAGEEFEKEWESAELASIEAHAAFGVWLNQQMQGGEAALAMALTGAEQRTLCRAASQALTRGMYKQALDILEIINEFWDVRGLTEEADAWTDRVVDALESPAGTPPDIDTQAGALWLFMVGSQAARSLNTGLLDQGEQVYLAIEKMLLASGSDNARRHLTTTYYQLGRGAKDRGELDQAEAWCKKALAIEDTLGNQSGMASSYFQLANVTCLQGDLGQAETWSKKALKIFKQLNNRPRLAAVYHQLGTVAQGRGELDQAYVWSKKALEIFEQLNDRPHMSAVYYQLGMVAQNRGELGQAEAWFKKVLEIDEALGNRPGIATTYHQLGMVDQDRGELGQAKAWYKKALEIFEQLNNQPDMAAVYHQLGTVAQKGGELSQAEAWHKKSLEINETLGNRPGLAMTYGQLGLLSEKQERAQKALEWTVRCVGLFDEFPHPSTGPGPKHLARLTRLLGLPALEAAWLRCHGAPLPEAVRQGVESMNRQTEE